MSDLPPLFTEGVVDAVDEAPWTMKGDDGVERNGTTRTITLLSGVTVAKIKLGNLEAPVPGSRVRVAVGLSLQQSTWNLLQPYSLKARAVAIEVVEEVDEHGAVRVSAQSSPVLADI